MKKYFISIIFILLFLVRCQPSENENNIEKWKLEIIETENAFNNMVQKEGIMKAFEYYAAVDGVIKRNNKIIKGKSAIAEWYEKEVNPNETLTWKPTFVDVSNSGEMAFTYGDFVFTYLDSIGNKKEKRGIFHTVWKRQHDGSWKFVWD